MTAQHKNRVQMTVTGTPGTGTITLNAASSGYQSFAAAYGANATVDVLITDGTAWEIARDCAYTHSGTTLSRGTLEASSTGSAISLTSAAAVSVTLTAEKGNRLESAALNQVAGTDADTTMEVGTLYVVDMSAWATADRTYTLPATAAVGDRVSIMISAGDASHELIITAASGDTLNGVAGGTEWSRLFITGELATMRCVAANATWVVEQDGRIPCQMQMTLSAAETSGTKTANTYFAPSQSPMNATWDTPTKNIGSCADTTNGRFVARRACSIFATAAIPASVSITDTNNFVTRLWDGTTGFALCYTWNSATGASQHSLAGSYALAVGGYVELQSRGSLVNTYISVSTRFNVVEVL